MADDRNPLAPLKSPTEWLDPWNYPSTVTNELAIAIALEIVHGADLRGAGMRHGVAPARLYRWLHWGEEAYKRDADGHDARADCLNLFLKVMQATGLALAPAEQRAYADNPGWWLAHSPDHRSSWGTQGLPAAVALDGGEEVTEQAPSPLETPTPDGLRRILKTIYASGGVLEQGDIATETPVVEADTTRETDAG